MVIGVILAVVIGIIILGAVLHLLKIAIIVALIVGGVIMVQRHLGTNDRQRLK